MVFIVTNKIKNQNSRKMKTIFANLLDRELNANVTIDKQYFIR